MKKLTCSQLGGACELEITADTFEELSEKSKAHAMEMFAQQEPAHMTAMIKMQHLMQDPEAMIQFMAEKKALFEAQPDI